MTEVARRGPRRAHSLAAAALLVAVTAGCAGGDPGDGAPTPGTSTPATGTTGAPSSSAAPETCDDLLPADVVDDFDAQGWTSREAPFQVGDIAIEGGLYCDWSDFTAPSGNVVSVGWAPIGPDEAATLQERLVDEGWVRDDAAATPTFADPGGFGLAFELGDGWVTFASPPEALVLVRHP